MEMVNVYRLHISAGDKINVSLEPSMNISLDEVTVCLHVSWTIAFIYLVISILYKSHSLLPTLVTLLGWTH